MRGSSSFLLLFFLLFGCDTPGLTELPGGEETPEADRLLIVYALGDGDISAHLEASMDRFLAVEKLPTGFELLLFAEIEGERQLYRRSRRETVLLSAEETSIPQGWGTDGETLAALLRYARERYPEAASHLLISGSSVFGDELGVAHTESGVLEAVEVARAGGAEGEPWLTSICLESSHGGSMSALYELQGSAHYLLASPGAVELEGLSVEALFAGLGNGEPTERALLRALGKSHEQIPGSSFALYDLSRVRDLADSLERVLLPLEQRLSGAAEERVRLRELLFDPSPYQRGSGPFFLTFRGLIATLSEEYPELGPEIEGLRAAASGLPRESWSYDSGEVSPGLYLVSLDEEGTPAGHAGCFLPERPGGEAGAFSRSTVWAPRLIEERGVLYFLWYDLLPPGGAS
jgi:hypothetical protein